MAGVVHECTFGRPCESSRARGQCGRRYKCSRRIIHGDGCVVLREGMGKLWRAVGQVRLTSLGLPRPVIRSSRRRPGRSCRRALRALRGRGEARGK
ncbi:hypothetical protein E2C01_082146 [Portunus trituberculatus]|uniref:Uncharacterized protein n=1 Tax=Portunus trituberculatus TaxID=210409 RepID=A0A5B7J2Z1_PORTR|nr:hypothetical protein [Portunus trituberculatus]